MEKMAVLMENLALRARALDLTGKDPRFHNVA
jgi:hypothetical protein